MMYQTGQHLGLTSTQKFNLVAGVILPAIAITVEATTNVCAHMFFDPIPTHWHLLLVILVPLTQLQVWMALRRNDPSRLGIAAVANALSIGVSLFYSFIYLPLIPFAALTLLIALGVLPLSPFFALVTALIMRKQLKRLAATGTHSSFLFRTRGLFAVLAFVAVFFAALELPPAITRYGLQMATSSSDQERSDGIRFLRKYGSRDYLLRRCYDERSRSLFVLGEFFSSENSVKADEARDIYYRVTGDTFDASPAPQSVNGRVILQNDVETDRSSDGTKISGILRGLSLTSSNISGSVDADGGVGQLNWAFEVENSFYNEKEVRAEIQLPPGAVVSSLTQSYGGVEREAEFTGRSPEIRGAQNYGDRSTRVLVSTAGRDRILVQAFPVTGYHSSTKINIGITVPLVLQSKDQARLVLPHFTARNFHISRNPKHWILIDSTHPLSSDLGIVHATPRPYNKGYQLLGEISDVDLMRPESALRLSRNDNDHGIWSPNPFEMDGSIVKQSLEARTPAHLRRVVVVVDTSASMGQWQYQIMTALRALPADMDVQLILADSDWRYETNRENVYANGIDAVTKLLASTQFVGGADNAPALGRAWDLATATPGNNAIVWIHGPQRVALESVKPLIERWEERFYGPSLYSVQTSVGSDEIEKKLDGIAEVKSVVRLGALQTDLERLFQQLSGRIPTYEFVRSVKHPNQNLDLEGIETSDQLARLWANDEVQRILSARDNSLREAATMLALRYKLVTPASGAVIQDSHGDFDSSNLESPRVATFSSVDEGDFGSLFFLTLIFFGWLIYVKARKANTGVIIP
ncbi:MAG TPA: hypothetical protein VHS05_10395 [Pyrinomonadaceae bacterium]|jgi:hypothetical protein|nr:hypothetical protein [Pyrinomonadaceae bacterium]